MPAPRRGKSEYGSQLAEKQKIRNTYRLRERQFKKYFANAKSPEEAYALLESRLDSAIYRLGFAITRGLAKQMVGHGHIMVNGRRVDIPSYKIKTGDVMSIRPGSAAKKIFENLDEQLKKYEPPTWLALDKEKKEGKVIGVPSPHEMGMEFNLQTVMEFYSR